MVLEAVLIDSFVGSGWVCDVCIFFIVRQICVEFVL